MKKVLFMVINMNVGGTEKALLNMIEEMPEEEYQITILMLEKRGDFLKFIPERVQVEYLQGYQELKPLLQNPPLKKAWQFIKETKISKGLNIAFFHIFSKLCKDRTIFFHSIFRSVPVFKNEYDIAIAYAGPMDFISYFIAERVKAETKLQWIHFDVTKVGFDPHFAGKIYQKFDKIFAVSKEGSSKLLPLLPDLEDRISVFPNVIAPQLVTKQAEMGKGFDDEFDGIRILTVGRLSKEKGQDLVIPVVAKLKEKGFNVRWYCIGEGKARKEYETLIKKNGVESDFVLLGATPNPYPYMNQCDIYVQPSRHEGYCITLAEAKCFSNPIISTDFTGAHEQLTEFPNGIIIPFDDAKMETAIQELIHQKRMEERKNKELFTFIPQKEDYEMLENS